MLGYVTFYKYRVLIQHLKTVILIYSPYRITYTGRFKNTFINFGGGFLTPKHLSSYKHMSANADHCMACKFARPGSSGFCSVGLPKTIAAYQLF